MKKKYIIAIIISLLGSWHLNAQHTLKVMTYNIRYNTPLDKENSWKYRKDAVVDLIVRHSPDILCIQEGLIDQVEYLDNKLQKYSYVGVGRSDGKTEGEFSAIFYNKQILKVKNTETFWLSPTPGDTASIGWDAALTRVATWAEISFRTTGKTFYVFNTHFDHKGEQARFNSSGLIKRKMNEVAENQPIILTGDFNQKSDSRPYHILTATDPSPELYDTRFAVKKPGGPEYTFVGFDNKGVDGDIIDFIFTSHHFKTNKHRILNDHWKDKYPSDHLPVMVEVSF